MRNNIFRYFIVCVNDIFQGVGLREQTELGHRRLTVCVTRFAVTWYDFLCKERKCRNETLNAATLAKSGARFVGRLAVAEHLHTKHGTRLACGHCYTTIFYCAQTTLEILFQTYYLAVGEAAQWASVSGGEMRHEFLKRDGASR